MTTTGTSTPDEGPPDDAVLSRLQGELADVVARVDPVPPAVLDAARAAFTLRALDEELAALVSDSALQSSGVRAELTTRLLSFGTSEGGGVDVELAGAADGTDLQGQVLGDAPGAVEVQHTGGSTVLEVDELGRFSARGLPLGRLRLTWLTRSGRRTTTPWFEG